MKSLETRKAAVEAVRQGTPIEAAATRYGVHRNTVTRWCRKVGVEAVDRRYGPREKELGVTWRTLDRLEREMPFCEAVNKTMLEWCP